MLNIVIICNGWIEQVDYGSISTNKGTTFINMKSLLNMFFNYN